MAGLSVLLTWSPTAVVAACGFCVWPALQFTSGDLAARVDKVAQPCHCREKMPEPLVAWLVFNPPKHFLGAPSLNFSDFFTGLRCILKPFGSADANVKSNILST
jgi:hypothetical protein